MAVELTVKDFTNDLTVERKVDTKLGIVFAEGFSVLAGEDRAVLYHQMGVVGRDDANLYMVNSTTYPNLRRSPE